MSGLSAWPDSRPVHAADRYGVIDARVPTSDLLHILKGVDVGSDEVAYVSTVDGDDCVGAIMACWYAPPACASKQLCLLSHSYQQ